MKLWTLIDLAGGLVHLGNVPALYDSKQEAWLDGDDYNEPRLVEVEIRELRRR